MALLDTNGDDCDDIVSLYPVNLTVVSGKDGEQLVGLNAASGLFEGIWAAYGSPTVFDLDGDGQPELVWNGGYCIGITDLKGEARWAKTPAAHGFPMDADGDGKWELVSPLGSELRWLDPADGETLRTLALPAAGTNVAIADINGDGTEEAVLSCGAQLVAARVEDGQPEVLWQLEAASAIQEFILADTDGDGKLEAVLSCSDGWLYGVDAGP